MTEKCSNSSNLFAPNAWAAQQPNSDPSAPRQLQATHGPTITCSLNLDLGRRLRLSREAIGPSPGSLGRKRGPLSIFGFHHVSSTCPGFPWCFPEIRRTNSMRHRLKMSHSATPCLPERMLLPRKNRQWINLDSSRHVDSLLKKHGVPRMCHHPFFLRSHGIKEAEICLQYWMLVNRKGCLLD